MYGDGRASPNGSPTPRAPYPGSRRKLVVAFDLGTTFSGVSYSVLDPGVVPVIKGVTQFPGQEAVSGGCKIPTVIYYDQEGNVRAVGAEAMEDGILEKAEDENWIKAEWFKLHLRSAFGSPKDLDSIPPLPPGKTVVEVVADFLSYLLKCTADFIRDTHRFGADLWLEFTSSTRSPDNAINDGIHWVLGHPNGWEGKEQTQMREAAVEAGLIQDTPEGQERISFITEGEASLHFAVQNDLLLGINDGEGIIVVDAGGGTIDISTYKQQGQKTKIFKEISEAECYYHGSVFVTHAAKRFLKTLLSDSRFLENLEHITSCFDKTTKLRFRNYQDELFIRFGNRSDNDPHANIRFGQIKLAGADIAKFFKASIDSVLHAVLAQKRKAPLTTWHVVLVGGFSANIWLFDRVRNNLAKIGMTVIRPEDNVYVLESSGMSVSVIDPCMVIPDMGVASVKAVSDGAVSFYLDRHVRTRVAKVTYGCPCAKPFRTTDPEHQKRRAYLFTDLDDTVYMQRCFTVILAKGTQVTEDEEFIQPFQTTSLFPNVKLDLAIHCYRGGNLKPAWVDVDSGNYTHLFRLQADLSRVPRRPLVNSHGQTYYKAECDVVIKFGLTELKGYLRWEENGVVKRSPARLIYE